MAAVALAIGQPTLVSVTHAFLDGFRNLVALSLESDYSFPAADKVPTVTKHTCSSSTV